MSSRFFVGETASDEARRPRSVRVKTELSKTQLNLPVRPPRARDSVRNARKESEASSSSDNEAKKPPPPRPSTPETIRRRQKGDLQEGVVAVEEKAKIERENRKSPKTVRERKIRAFLVSYFTSSVVEIANGVEFGKIVAKK